MIVFVLSLVLSADRWVETPHHADGYWTEQTAESLGWGEHPFNRYVWDWKGRLPADRTLVDEWYPGRPPARPQRWMKIKTYDPLWPGQRKNL